MNQSNILQTAHPRSECKALCTMKCQMQTTSVNQTDR